MLVFHFYRGTTGFVRLCPRMVGAAFGVAVGKTNRSMASPPSAGGFCPDWCAFGLKRNSICLSLMGGENPSVRW